MPPRQTLRARHLRRTMNRTEWRVWSRLSNRQLDGFKFRRQHPIGEHVVDFYCPSARLVVEIDGPIHDYTEQHDISRSAQLYASGCRVLRFPVSVVDEDLDSVIETIFQELTDPHPPRLAARAGAPSP